MPIAPNTALQPRKKPTQARSQATVDAIFEATIQVLLSDGIHALTTIRVAGRAGVSVGTLYQYYPNKQALLYAVLERHLHRLGETVEVAIKQVHGATIAVMVGGVVEAFVKVKTDRVDEARALYAVASDLGAAELIKSAEEHGVQRIADMLRTAADAQFADVHMTAYIFTAAMVGPTRAMLEGGSPPSMLAALRPQLESLCLGYLEREALSC